MKASFDARDLKASVLFASKDDSRRILCGVGIQVEGKKATISTTDSYKAIECIDEKAGMEDGACIIDAKELKAHMIAKVKRVNVSYNAGDRFVELSLHDANNAHLSTAAAPIIEGTFPSVSKIMPKKTASVPYIRLNCEYVISAMKAIDTWEGGKASTIIQTGAQGNKLGLFYAAAKDAKRSMRIVIMPIRTDDNEKKKDKRILLAPSGKTSQEVTPDPVEQPAPVKQEDAKPAPVEKTAPVKSDIAPGIKCYTFTPKDNKQQTPAAPAPTPAAPVKSISEDAGIDELESFAKTLEGVTTKTTSICFWIEGNTKPYKEELKAAGFRWAPKRKAWYRSIQAIA